MGKICVPVELDSWIKLKAKSQLESDGRYKKAQRYIEAEKRKVRKRRALEQPIRLTHAKTIVEWSCGLEHTEVLRRLTGILGDDRIVVFYDRASWWTIELRLGNDPCVVAYKSSKYGLKSDLFRLRSVEETANNLSLDVLSGFANCIETLTVWDSIKSKLTQ